MLFLDNETIEIIDQLEFEVIGRGYEKIGDYQIRIVENPKDMYPIVLDITLKEKYNQFRVCDNMVIVFYSKLQYEKCSKWYTKNTNLSWTRNLPRPFSSIQLFGNTPVDPDSDDWAAPHSINTFLHHNAKYEMRTSISSKEGNQATYNEVGNLITNTIAAGTADKYAPYGKITWLIRSNTNHREYDVYPFIRLLQMDGNPGVPNVKSIPTNLNRPCIYQGLFINKYLERRPIILP